MNERKDRKSAENEGRKERQTTQRKTTRNKERNTKNCHTKEEGTGKKALASNKYKHILNTRSTSMRTIYQGI
jgi:hypothetical protein